jgi:Ca-activated chloride channel family protein
VVHTPAANDDWMKAGEAELEKLRDKLREDESKRSAHVSLVRGLLARGRFEEAKQRALHLAEIDPDSSLALDLVAQASLAAGDRAAALGALDALAELSPRSAAVHRRIARGLEAAGDERRACAHWRSIATLDANDAEGKAESLRCRARSLGERDEVVREIEALSSSDRGRAGTSLDPLLAAARLGSLPAYTPKTAWSVVTTKCGSGATCPESFAVDVAGNVASALLPNERGEPGLTARSGTVRTVIVGKVPPAKTTIDVAFEGGSRSVTVEARRTIALSQSRALF